MTFPSSPIMVFIGALFEYLVYGVIVDLVAQEKLFNELGISAVFLDRFQYAISWVEYSAELGHDMEGGQFGLSSYEVFADCVSRVG